jgi:glycosyltransferase involved in cell wall biosynthesis
MSPIRIAVALPFFDKRYATERMVGEWISRLPQEYEIHVYSQLVKDLDLTRMKWHRIPTLPGPHFFNFLWWFVANQVCRWWDSHVRGLRYDLVYTAGTNCLDADIISVFIIFSEFFRQVAPELKLSENPIRFWPRLLHRRLYYKLIIFLEKLLYANPKKELILIAQKTAKDLKHFYSRVDGLQIVYIGLDQNIFNVESRVQNRAAMRAELELRDDQCVLFLVGNDLKKKGITALLQALAALHTLPLILLIAGKDDPLPYRAKIRELGLEERIVFLPLRKDVQSYYAAADVYVGPSLEDTFAFPPLEAMACGLPVITTVTNGTVEIMTDGVDALIMQDPNDANDLAAKIRLLCEDAALRQRLGDEASHTAKNHTLDRNGEQIRAIFAEALHRKGLGEAAPVARPLP